MTHTQDKSSALAQGLTIFIFLAVLTALEFGIAIAINSTILLVLVALIKAGLVAYYYMHIYKLNQDEHGEGHERENHDEDRGDVQVRDPRSAAGAVTVNYGQFINTIINFLIIAAVVFFLIVRPLAKLQEKQKATAPVAAPTTKECPFCYSAIPIKATRCPSCTSQLGK